MDSTSQEIEVSDVDGQYGTYNLRIQLDPP